MSQAGVAVHAWKPPIPGIREVFHARLGEHAYPLHTHDAWTLFIVDEVPSITTSTAMRAAPSCRW